MPSGKVSASHRYSHLRSLLALAGSHELTLRLRQRIRWPNEAATLEELASSLTIEERETLAFGEGREVNVLLRVRPELVTLDIFISEALDVRCKVYFVVYSPSVTYFRSF